MTLNSLNDLGEIMMYSIDPNKSLVRPKTTESDVEQGDVCTRAYSIRLTIESKVDNLHDMLHHDATDPVAIHRAIMDIKEWSDEYSWELFKKGHDLSKAITLEEDE